jgi:xanthine dehydrogenase small subunit
LRVEISGSRLLRDHVSFIFRGAPLRLAGFPPTRSVLDWLREDRRAVGTKEGCNEGDCGACTAVLARVEDGRLVHRPVNTCITFLGMLDGCELLTIEDLAEGGALHPIQQAMVDLHGSQCGFCTPGIVMSLFAMTKEEGPVTRERVNDQLAGNLCRCTGYRPIVDAALASVGQEADRFDRRREERIAALRALDDGAGAMVASGDGFFAAPRTLADLLALAAAHPDATILAGATDVGLWITKQFRPVTRLIWLGRVAELQHIDDGPEALTIGAGVSHEDAMPRLAAIAPDLGELGRRFGSKQVRAQGTVGGNIANGSPIGDWAPAFIALGAEVELAGGEDRRRRIPLEAFFIAYGKQDRRPG